MNKVLITIDIVKVVSFIIKLVFIISIGIFFLLINNEKKSKRKGKFFKSKSKEEKNKMKAIRIIELFEELLEEKNIKIPSSDRNNSEDEACIYGKEYYELEDNIFEILNEKY